MRFKARLLMLFCLLISSSFLISGCQTTLINVLGLDTTQASTQSNTTYDNVVDGLLNTTNEQGLEVHYMILPTNHKKVGYEMSKPTYIVVHNTANTAPAVNEVTYLNRSSNTSYTSFHFAVDDVNVYQAVNMKYNAWHAGENTMNRKSIGIEIAKSMISDTTIKDKAINNGAKLVAMLMIEYDIPIERVITHQAVTGKHCPHDILDRYGYDKFLNLVRSYLK